MMWDREDLALVQAIRDIDLPETGRSQRLCCETIVLRLRNGPNVATCVRRDQPGHDWAKGTGAATV